MIGSFLRDSLFPAYLRWSGKRHLLPLFNSVVHAGQPSESSFPSELLEQGLATVLSGLSNTLVVQSNPGWVWPYWVERQIDPDSESFLPTATNIIKSNLTHRNWTSMGVDGSSREAMVDPVGMLTLHPYGWSVFPFLRMGEAIFLPPRMRGRVRQELEETTLQAVVTRYSAHPGLSWTSEALPVLHDSGELMLFTHRLRNESKEPMKLTFGLTLRPYNPLMFAPINHLAYHDGRFRVNGEWSFYLAEAPDRVSLSNRRFGDPLIYSEGTHQSQPLASRSGILAAAAEYDWELPPGGERVLYSTGVIARSRAIAAVPRKTSTASRVRIWELDRLRNHEAEGLHIEIPDAGLERAFRAVKGRLHVFDDVSHFSPGTFLYHEHWFRDTAFLALAFDQMGFGSRVHEKAANFMRRQRSNGFFRSQNGEWDSNGQALWTLITHVQRGGDAALLAKYYAKLIKGGRWIDWMRRKTKTLSPFDIAQGSLHYGLLPAGLSAEHFGPNDHYYWDDLWSIAGLEKLIWTARLLGKTHDVAEMEKVLREFRGDVEKSMARSFAQTGYQGLPCSPHRALDSAAIGNMVALSPLSIVNPNADWVGGTIEFLVRSNLRDGLFMQKIIHTGLNTYLSAQLARALMRRNDPHAFEILQAILRHGGPTLSWPEAIHPRTLGGCMGDGDHGWAAAEFLNLVRDVLVREESGQLWLLSAAPESWFHNGAVIKVTSAPTLHGTVSFHLEVHEHSLSFNWNVSRKPHQDSGEIVLCLPSSFSQSLGMPGIQKGPHLQITLSEDSGRRVYETSIRDTQVSSLQRSLHVQANL